MHAMACSKNLKSLEIGKAIEETMLFERKKSGLVIRRAGGWIGMPNAYPSIRWLKTSAVLVNAAVFFGKFERFLPNLCTWRKLFVIFRKVLEIGLLFGRNWAG